jgi:hypothetical protein
MKVVALFEPLLAVTRRRQKFETAVAIVLVQQLRRPFVAEKPAGHLSPVQHAIVT